MKHVVYAKGEEKRQGYLYDGNWVRGLSEKDFKSLLNSYSPGACSPSQERSPLELLFTAVIYGTCFCLVLYLFFIVVITAAVMIAASMGT